MSDSISIQLMQDVLDRVSAMHPYREIGNRESYSTYNEAWTDAINMVDAELNSMPPAQPEPILLPTIHIVEGYDTVEDENGNKGFGVYVPGDKVIYVAGDVPYEIKLKTLLHELCHWIQDISGREFNEFEAENFSNFMYGVIDMTIDLYKSGEVKTEGQA